MNKTMNVKIPVIGPWSFYKTALKIAVPIMLQLLIQSLISLIDNFMVSGLGDAKMGAVNVANQLNMIIFVLFNSICSAGGIFISQYNGIKDSEGMKQAYRFKIIVCVLIGFVYMLVSLFLSEYLLVFMLKGNKNEIAIMEQGVKYARIIAFTWIPIAISTAIGSSMRESENVKTPLMVSVIATLVNTIFNWLLIYGNLGFPRMEVEGAAVATLIARVVEMGSYIVYCKIKKPLFYSRWRNILKVKFALFTSIMRKSLFVIIAEMSWIITETIMNKFYNGRGGSEVVAGMASAWAVANLFQLVITGISISTSVLIGGTLGRGELEYAKKQARWMKSGAIISGCFVALLEIASTGLLQLIFFKLSPEAISISRNMLIIISLYIPLWNLLNAQFATARAGGDALMGTVVDVTVNTFLFLPGILIIGLCTQLGPVAMFGILKLTDLVKTTIAEWQLRKERWVKNLTVNTQEAQQI